MTLFILLILNRDLNYQDRYYLIFVQKTKNNKENRMTLTSLLILNRVLNYQDLCYLFK
jgi:hypothetical protein